MSNSPTKATKKAFALASLLGSCIRSIDEDKKDIDIVVLAKRIDDAMKVFSIKANNAYWDISEKTKEVWVAVSSRHESSLTEDEITVFIEYLCMCIHPKNFKEYLGIEPYKSKHTLPKEKLHKVVHSILDADNELNKTFGTKPYTMSPPPKVKVKVKKERTPSKKKKVKVKNLTSNQRKERERHKKAKDFLAKRIAEAKGTK